MAKKSFGVDQFGNLEGKTFDLGGEDDARLKGEKILLVVSYLAEPEYYQNAHELLIPTMAERNLKLDVAKYDEFSRLLNRNGLRDYTQLWYISDQAPHLTSQQVNAIVEYNKAGNGLMIWADNEPYYADANLLAQATVKSHFTGNKTANELMKPGAKLQPGMFIEHQLTFGLNSLYEGITICDINPGEGVQIIAQSHDGQRCMGAYSRGDQRVVLDTGFTKIMNREVYFRTAGTARYFNNVAFWLAKGARDSAYKLLTGPERLATIRHGQSSEAFGYEVKEPSMLRYVLSWQTSDEVSLEIINPQEGRHKLLQGRQSPLQAEIPGADKGVWKCRVRGVNIAKGDLQYVLTVVEQKGGIQFSPKAPPKAQVPHQQPLPPVVVTPTNQWLFYLLIDCSSAAAQHGSAVAQGVSAIVKTLRSTPITGITPAVAFGESRQMNAALRSPLPLTQNANLNLATSGETALVPALTQLIAELEKPRPANALGKPLVVVVLVGEPHDEYEPLAQRVQQMAAGGQLNLFVVGIGDAVSGATLRKVARIALRVSDPQSGAIGACFDWLGQVGLHMMRSLQGGGAGQTINLPPIPAGVQQM